MDNSTASIIVAIIAVVGSCISAFGGILVSSKLTAYRIEQLEKQVEKHNNLIERMYKVEEHNALLDEQMKVANHRIADLEKKGEEI